MRKARTDIAIPTTLSKSSPTASTRQGVGFVVPKGDILLASPMISQLDPDIWADPEAWDPLRWYDEKGTAAMAGKQYQ